MHVLSLFL